MAGKGYIGNKLSRARAMMAMGIMAGAMMIAPGVMAKDAHAAGMFVNETPQLTEQQKKQHQQFVKKNFVEKTVYVEVPGTRFDPTPRREARKILVPTKQHQQRINQAMQNLEDTILENRIDALEQEPTGNSFRDSLSVNNPNSQYFTPGYESNVRSNVRINNSHIHGNVRIGQVTDDRGRW